MRRLLVIVCVTALLAACSGGSSTPSPTPVLTPAAGMNAPGVPVVGGEVASTPSGLKYVDLTVGKGAVPANGQHVTISYEVWVVPSGQSITGPKPVSLTFIMGDRQVIKGLEEGVASMHVGGKRRLLVPPDLGFGAAGLTDKSNVLVLVPPGSTMLIDVAVTAAK